MYGCAYSPCLLAPKSYCCFPRLIMDFRDVTVGFLCDQIANSHDHQFYLFVCQAIVPMPEPRGMCPWIKPILPSSSSSSALLIDGWMDGWMSSLRTTDITLHYIHGCTYTKFIQLAGKHCRTRCFGLRPIGRICVTCSLLAWFPDSRGQGHPWGAEPTRGKRARDLTPSTQTVRPEEASDHGCSENCLRSKVLF